MAEWLYLEYVLAERERDLTEEDRPLLSTGLGGWTWLRACHVGALVGLALLAILALPMGILGVAWILRGILSVLGG